MNDTTIASTSTWLSPAHANDVLRPSWIAGLSTPEDEICSTLERARTTERADRESTTRASAPPRGSAATVLSYEGPRRPTLEVPPPAPSPEPEAASIRASERARDLDTMLQSTRLEIERAKARAAAAMEGEVVRLALAIAERIVLRELTIDPSVARGWAREALTALGGTGPVEVRVSSAMAGHLATLEPRHDADALLDVVVDPDLPESELRVSSRHGSVDAGLAPRLASIRAALAAEDEAA